ncbi:MAG: hypothetical protein FD167_5392 [bacterium]|nr:MAG: hypothetical protein FD167_5392 [bacterium]
MAENGVIDSKYPLIETSSRNYPERTKLNVIHSNVIHSDVIIRSDVTLILSLGRLGRGTSLTIKLAQEQRKHYLLVDLKKFDNYPLIIDWLKENQISTLNIAGSRETGNPGIYKQAYLFLEQLLAKIKL